MRVGETFEPRSDVDRLPWVEAFVLFHGCLHAVWRGPFLLHVVLLLGCAVVIYLACEWFVNAVEWLGVRRGGGPGAVGTVLAAVGTALPESVVTLVAVLFGGKESGDDIGVGAALGGPLVVGTIAYAVTGLVLLRRRRVDRVAARSLDGTDTPR